MIFTLVFFLILNLEYNLSFYFYIIFLFWRNFLTSDYIIFYTFFKNPNLFITQYKNCSTPNTDHHHWLIYSFKLTDLPHSKFFWDKFLYLYNFLSIKLIYVWQPIFKKHSYFMYFRSNRDFWLINKLK